MSATPDCPTCGTTGWQLDAAEAARDRVNASDLCHVCVRARALHKQGLCGSCTRIDVAVGHRLAAGGPFPAQAGGPARRTDPAVRRAWRDQRLADEAGRAELLAGERATVAWPTGPRHAFVRWSIWSTVLPASVGASAAAYAAFVSTAAQEILAVEPRADDVRWLEQLVTA